MYSLKKEGMPEYAGSVQLEKEAYGEGGYIVDKIQVFKRGFKLKAGRPG